MARKQWRRAGIDIYSTPVPCGLSDQSKRARVALEIRARYTPAGLVSGLGLRCTSVSVHLEFKSRRLN